MQAATYAQRDPQKHWISPAHPETCEENDRLTHSAFRCLTALQSNCRLPFLPAPLGTQLFEDIMLTRLRSWLYNFIYLHWFSNVSLWSNFIGIHISLKSKCLLSNKPCELTADHAWPGTPGNSPGSPGEPSPVWFPGPPVWVWQDLAKQTKAQ